MIPKGNENSNQNPINVNIPEQKIPVIQKNSVCDINHDHVKEGDMTELSSTLCNHSYFKSCLLKHLYANIESYKNIDEIKCPVEGCNKFLPRQTVQQFEQFVDKFDDIISAKRNQN